MIRLSLVILMLAASAARAEVALVTSGEHAGYSRLLVTAAATPDGWRLTRTPDGYALDAGPATTGFDLSRAFDRIPRTRITALFADPEDGHLRIRVGCECHAIAFLHEGRHLVVDVRDGPPPVRSAFENGADGGRLPALRRVEAKAPAAGTPRYDWLSSTRPDRTPAPPSPAVAVPGRPDTGDLRAALLAGISRGSAAGVIGLTLPPDAPVAMPAGMALFNGGTPGLVVDSDPGDDTERIPSDVECPATARFDIGTWATGDPLILQFGRHRTALLGEFDSPDRSAISAAIRFYLHLGFGAEAVDLMRVFPDHVEDRHVWSMMAAVLDGEAADETTAHGWMRCDTAAALWATLALPAVGADPANRQAIRQAFGMLPPHLRIQLAPALRERAVLLEDAELAASIGAAADRGAVSPPAGTAPATLLAAWRDGGSDAVPAALAYIAAAHAEGQPVPAEVPGALLALAEDYRSLPEADTLARAGRLAAALAGDFDVAFADEALVSTMPELWQGLVDAADNDTFISIAVAHRRHVPQGQPDLSSQIAARFLDLRLPELALDWLPATPATSASVTTAAAALIALGRGREALGWLDGLPPDEGVELRAMAADQAGEYRLAAEAWAAAGDPGRAMRSARLAGAPLAATQPSAWQRIMQDAAGATLSRGAEGAGALQNANALMEASAGLRADIGALLSGTALPQRE
jgi:hypothetical protein